MSKYLSYREAFVSQHHPNVNNTPSKRQKELVERFAKEYFDALREASGGPLYVSSLYRSKELNYIVKGAKNSDHQILFDIVACDIDQDGHKGISNRALFFLIMHKFDYRTLIWEYDNPLGVDKSGKAFPHPRWVHISWSSDPAKNKLKKTYRAVKRGNRTVYLDFSTSGI